VNISQLVLQYNIGSQTLKRRQLWIDQAKAKALETHSQRIAIVTGGNTGLGYETAKALVEAGYRTVIGKHLEGPQVYEKVGSSVVSVS